MDEITKILLAEEVNRVLLIIIGMVITAGIAYWTMTIGRNIVAGLQIRRSDLYQSASGGRKFLYKGSLCRANLSRLLKTEIENEEGYIWKVSNVKFDGLEKWEVPRGVKDNGKIQER